MNEITHEVLTKNGITLCGHVSQSARGELLVNGEPLVWRTVDLSEGTSEDGDKEVHCVFFPLNDAARFAQLFAENAPTLN